MLLDEDQMDRLAAELAPRVAQRLLLTKRVFGDERRLHIAPTANVTNALFNLASGSIFVDDFVFCGHDVSILTGTHDVEAIDHARQASIPKAGRDIHIERGVWIASNATIIGPCRIGKHAVIGVGAVVLGDVAAGWFYAGVPARPVKMVVPGEMPASMMPLHLGDGLTETLPS